jgi:hypothetical protein
MSSVFRAKNLQDTGIDNVFFFEKSCRKMYTMFSAVQRQQRKSDVMTSFSLTACSAVYYQDPHCRFLITGCAQIQEIERAASGHTIIIYCITVDMA